MPSVFPGLVIALEEIANFGRAYGEQVIANARTLAHVLDASGVSVAGMEYGGTETHQVHVRLGAADVANKVANELLPMCGIRTNSVLIPGTGGAIRSAAGHAGADASRTHRDRVCQAGRVCSLGRCAGPLMPRQIRHEVAELLADYPLYPVAFQLRRDPRTSQHVERLLSEVLR